MQLSLWQAEADFPAGARTTERASRARSKATPLLTAVKAPQTLLSLEDCAQRYEQGVHAAGTLASYQAD
ncbi:MAG: hypothetical protein JWN04_3215, partial [Myxococcaceae bacterium]|nr:hypothetical protein [Myxococcaceae bacterium]